MRKFQCMDWRGRAHGEYGSGYPFDEFLGAQDCVWKQRFLGLVPDTLILAYHPPTITLGSRPLKEQLPHIRPLPHGWLEEENEEELFVKTRTFLRSRHSVNLVKTTRGGSVWYHDQGVLGLYLIVELGNWFPTEIVWRLEEALYQALSLFLPVERSAGRKERDMNCFIGMWVHGKKIGGIGVRVEGRGGRRISKFGAALNIKPNMRKLALIDPCGIAGREGTSFVEELPGLSQVSVELDFLPIFYQKLSAVFEAEFVAEEKRIGCGV